MARVCIVTASALGSNPRVVKEAQALSGAGYTVHVISLRSLPLVDRRDEAILEKAPWTSERIDLRARPGRWWRAVFSRLGDIFSGVFNWPPFNPMATASLTKRAMRWPADLYIAHYVAALPAAAKAAQKFGVPYAFDAEDFHPGDLPETREYASDRAQIHHVEARWLPGAAYVSAASPGIALAYSSAYRLAKKPTVILNTFPLAQAPAGPTTAGIAQPGPSLYWFSQTIGGDRGLECAVRALGRSKVRPHLYLRGSPSPGYAEKLLHLAHCEGVGGHVHLLEPAMPQDMEGLASAFDLGLVGETGGTRNRNIALTNKQFTYLLAGIPAVMSDTEGHCAFVAEAEGGAVLFKAEDPDDLARVLDELLVDPQRLAVTRRQAYDVAQRRYNWEFDAVRLVAQVDAAVGVERQSP